MKHVFILNPAAGKSDQTPRFSQDIERICGARGLDYEICVSKAPGDCRALARKACETGQEVRLYACGGDGTLNEVVCGMAGCPNAAVTHYPGGSGNDAIKVFSDTAPFFDLERLLDADETRFDLIRCNDTYCANILSIGLDAKIGTDMVRFKRLPLVTGKGAYILSILANILSGRSAHYAVELNGETIDAEQTLICVCNGRWYGGGFNPVPEAEPDDGLLDVLLVKKVSLLQVAAVFGNRFFFGGRLLRSRFFGSGLLCLRGLGISGSGFCRSAGAAGQNGGKQQSGKRQCKKFFHFGVLLSVRCSGAENFCPGAWVCDLY